MTEREMSEAIGQPVLYESHGLQFVCVVVDIKISWGKPRFLITPLKGAGQTWVEYTTITPMPRPALTKRDIMVAGLEGDKEYGVPVVSVYPALYKREAIQNVSAGYAAIPSGRNGMIVR